MPHMSETHAAFMRRIKDEGKADEVQLEYTRQVEQGYKPAKAWQRVKHKYPAPRSNGEPVKRRRSRISFAKLDPEIFKDKKPTTFREDLDWATENLAYRKVDPATAPSARAWLLWHQMREDKAFMQSTLQKCIPNKSELGKDGDFEDDGRKEFKLIDKLLSEFGAPGNNQQVLQTACSQGV
jgi:hypothetical protein